MNKLSFLLVGFVILFSACSSGEGASKADNSTDSHADVHSDLHADSHGGDEGDGHGDHHGEHADHGNHGEEHHGHGHAEGASVLAEGEIRYEQEKHLKNLRQLTKGGENAEAYWSFDQQSLCLQRRNPDDGIDCDQIYWMKLPGAETEGMPKLMPVSKNVGRTTCAYFMKGDQEIIFASTESGSKACPPDPDKSKGYVWPLYTTFELYTTDLEGNNKKRLSDNNFYDAEATLSPDGELVVFTSTRDGDIDLYTMKPDGSEVNRVTHGLGYDGGAFFSADGKKLIFRASRPKTEEEVAKYTSLLKEDLVAPMDMELYICDVDGSNLKQITDLGGANWAPYMHPDGERVIFCSNHKSKSGFPFNLFMINLDGTGLEQITYNDMFDSFPMFSKDGSKLVFASNRNNGGTRDTNVFIADWVD